MNLKALIEARNKLVADMQLLVDTANAETRALTNEELASTEELRAKVEALDKTINTALELRKLTLTPMLPDAENRGDTKEKLETRAFENYIRGIVTEERDGEPTNLTKGDNGAVIPTIIANKIITRVEEISPIYALSQRYIVSGNLTIPYYDNETDDITCDYTSEFTELESHIGKLKSIELKGYLLGALALVSKSLINNSAFDLVGFVIERMAVAVARKLEKELLDGTENKIEGLGSLTPAVTAASTTKITMDELIDLQEEIPDIFRPGAVWIMSKAARKAIRKLKDGNGNYLLNKDTESRWGYTLLGNDVFVSDNMPAPAAGKRAVIYGDLSGLAVKISEGWEIDVLREKFATQHALGVYTYFEADAKIEHAQKIAALSMAAGS